MDVKVRKVLPNAVIPAYQTDGAAGFDLVAAEEAIIYPGQTAKVRTGLAFSVPEGYALLVVPRSGLSFNTKLRIANAPGVVDSDYRGEVCVLVDNVSPVLGDNEWDEGWDVVGGVPHADDDTPTRYRINVGDRIAQGIIVPVKAAAFIVVDELDATERGAGGFGSTGVGSGDGGMASV